jgi:DNA-binding PucR family transcriptional regulator
VNPQPDERVCLDARRHGVVLMRPFVRAYLVAALGIVLLGLPWPVPVAAPIVLAVSAALAIAAVWRWDRTRLVVTSEKVFLVQGIARRRASAVMLRSLRLVAHEQSLVGRLLGYGTVHAGPLEVPYVARPREVCELVERLAG